MKEGKKHAGPQPQKWVRVAAQAKGTFRKGQGCQCCSAANMTATSNARQRQYTGPWAQPPAPPDIKVDLLPHSAKLHQERQQD